MKNVSIQRNDTILLAMANQIVRLDPKHASLDWAPIYTP